MTITLTCRAAWSLLLCLLCSACLRFGYAPERRNQAGRSGAGGGGEIDAGVPRVSTDGGGALVPTDAASGDAGASNGGMDASTISELPPTPVDAGPEAEADEDAGTTMTLVDAGITQVDAGIAQVDAGMMPADAAVTSPCLAGRELGGYCWFLGEVGQSCDAVCAAHGGFVPSLPYIGSRAQGGSLSLCDAVLTLLTVEGATQAGYRQDGRGVGCHLFEGDRWWLTSPNFSPTASHSKAQEACSCADR